MKPVETRLEIKGETLVDAGFSREEIDRFFAADEGERTRMLIGKYDPCLNGRRLGALLRAIRTLGDPEMVADFYVEVIKGDPVPAQLLVLQSAQRPEWRRFDRVDRALIFYQSDFESLTEAYSWYEDKRSCGCGKRSGSCG